MFPLWRKTKGKQKLFLLSFSTALTQLIKRAKKDFRFAVYKPIVAAPPLFWQTIPIKGQSELFMCMCAAFALSAFALSAARSIACQALSAPPPPALVPGVEKPNCVRVQMRHGGGGTETFFCTITPPFKRLYCNYKG